MRLTHTSRVWACHRRGHGGSKAGGEKAVTAYLLFKMTAMIMAIFSQGIAGVSLEKLRHR